MDIEITHDNYFEIAEALHAVLTLWHDGKHGYAVLCKSQFKPGHGWRTSTVEEENYYFNDIESMVNNHQGYGEIEKLMDDLNDFVNELDD